MANKTARPVSEPDVWESTGTPKMLVRIEGLQQVGDDTFELSGVQPRGIDWPAVGAALGYESMPDDLADDIAAAVWDHDILQVLRSRIKRA